MRSTNSLYLWLMMCTKGPKGKETELPYLFFSFYVVIFGKGGWLMPGSNG